MRRLIEKDPESFVLADDGPDQRKVETAAAGPADTMAFGGVTFCGAITAGASGRRDGEKIALPRDGERADGMAQSGLPIARVPWRPAPEPGQNLSPRDRLRISPHRATSPRALRFPLRRQCKSKP